MAPKQMSGNGERITGHSLVFSDSSHVPSFYFFTDGLHAIENSYLIT